MTGKTNYTGWGLALGATLGTVFGIMVGHIGVWLGIGFAIGILIGSSLRGKEPACRECAEIHRMHRARAVHH
jgi:hypothetical protein